MRWRHLLFTLCIGSALLLLQIGVNAQDGGILPGETAATNPKPRTSTVTAFVPDIVPPSTPILIDPEDEEVVTTSTPTFHWQGSTDNVGVTGYQLWLDGALLYDSIPTTATNNASYILLYDITLQQYFLTPKSGLSEGDHTWQIRAYDAAGNTSSSVIWDFEIDTTAPYFEITDIGPESVFIHTGDAGTVPDEPIVLTDNEPLLEGTGEAGAEVQLTITIPGDPTQNHTFTVALDGTWSFQTGIFPRDTIITFDFVITDSAGNVSVISDLEIIIEREVIIIPPPPTPTPSPTPSPPLTEEPTPTPGVSPQPSPSVSPSPSPSPTPIPGIVIPIFPPQEIAYEVVQEITERLPTFITDSVVADVVTAVSRTISQLSPAGAIIVTALPATVSLLALLLQFGGNLTWELFLRILQAIGLLPVKEPQGIVFNSDTNQPIPFALLTITNTNPDDPFFETVVTDEHGIYQGIKLPKGEYTIVVTHQDYLFPTEKKRPAYLTVHDFYMGEVFTVRSDNTHQLFLIPVDAKKETKETSTWRNKIRIAIEQMRIKNLTIPLFILSLIITILSPSLFNKIVIVFYLLLFAKKYLITNRKANLVGTIEDAQGVPLENAIIKLSNPATAETVALATSNTKGKYALYYEPGQYYISVTKTGYVWYRESGSMGFEEVTLQEKRVSYPITLTSVETIMESL